ncbi:MAG: cytochrome c biogenesis protein ResB, partial [Candidatus Eisenbacteria bacterium]
MERKRNRGSAGGPLRWLTLQLSRIRLTVWLLIVMGVTMIVGSIFPQGYGPDIYIESWGEARYELFSKLGFLNLFHSKYFLVLGIILLLNLVFCSVLRWARRSGSALASSKPPDHARTIAMRGSAGSALETARS